jgi:hypothetical protein
MSNSAGRSAIVGVGYSKILRDKGIDGRPLAVEASRAAIADAGLAVRDVEAVFEHAGDWVDGGKTIGTRRFASAEHQRRAARRRAPARSGFSGRRGGSLRGDCGKRQVPDADVAVVANGFGPQCGSVVLRV